MLRGHNEDFWGITPWTPPFYDDERRYGERCPGSSFRAYTNRSWFMCPECGCDQKTAKEPDERGRRKLAEHTAPESRYAS